MAVELVQKLKSHKLKQKDKSELMEPMQEDSDEEAENNKLIGRQGMRQHDHDGQSTSDVEVGQEAHTLKRGHRMNRN